MTNNYKQKGYKRTVIFLLLVAGFVTANAAITLDNLMTEYAKTPIGIDVTSPRFNWQMVAPDGERGYSQTAYQIEVKNADDEVVWNTGKVTSNISLGIAYEGSPLQAATRYFWTVTVWDQDGTATTSTSWFETGLMNADIGAWSGARWIGGGPDDMVLYAPYLAIYNVEYTMAIEEGSSAAGFIYAANDSRLMDKYKNIYQVENARNESYIELELDIADVDGSEEGTAKLNIYRSGYTDTDDAQKPFKTFEIKKDFINIDNKNASHTIRFTSIFGQISVALDDSSDFIIVEERDQSLPPDVPPEFMRRESGASANLNPIGSGGNYIPFGMLCEIGFSADAGQKAVFSDVRIYNNRLPNNTLFTEDLSGSGYNGTYTDYVSDPSSGLSISQGNYVVDGGSAGAFIVADPSKNSTPMLRTEFTTNGKKVEDARLYITSRGIYEVYMNGKKVGDDYYNPGLTQYNITHMYQTYDVTGQVINGKNALGAIMSEGWWSGLLSFGNIWNHFGDRQSLLAKLVIKYEDGTSDIIITNDSNWKYFNEGPVIYGSLDMGEAYDATKEAAIDGWTKAGYDDSKWTNTVVIPLEGTAFIGTYAERFGPATDFNYDQLALTGQVGNSAGIYKIISAKSVEEVRPGVFVYNMGQNVVGVPRISIEKGKAGGKMTLRFSEMLYPDLEESGRNVGMIMTENYRAALSQDVYTMKEGSQIYQPRFTSHGFQYIEITGIDEPLPLDAVQSVAISSVRLLTADYSTSNPKVNQLWSNLVWSNIDNFLTIPTDCPQRNERMGWSGDINVFSRTATYVSNSDQFLTRHMYAMRDVQLPSGKFTDIAPVGGGFGGVLWGSAGIVVPWETYNQYNDVALLKQHYPAMVAYIDYIETTIDYVTGLSSDGQLGDWLGPQNNQLGTAYLVTAYHAYDLYIMWQVAELLGKTSDAGRFRSLFEQRKKFFNKTFVSEDKKALGLIGGGRGFGPQPATPPEYKEADVQTAYAVGLGMDLFNDENKPYMIKNLAAAIERQNTDDDGVIRPEYSLMTGFIGTSWISKALSDNGQVELAYKLLQNDQYPSWLYSIDQGATSIWERLNGYTVENGFGGNNSMNSFNHYSFGAVGQWMMAYSLGIQRDEPGFQRFILQPEPDPAGQMTSAGGYYDSMYGRINSAWSVNSGTLTYAATVPANTTATLYLPATSADSVKEGGKTVKNTQGITFIKFENGKAVYELKSGDYLFTSDI